MREDETRKRKRAADTQERKRLKTDTEALSAVALLFRQSTQWKAPQGSPYINKKKRLGLVTSRRFCSQLLVEVFEDTKEASKSTIDGGGGAGETRSAQ